MGDANEGKRTFNWMENLSLQAIRNPRDWFVSIETRELAVTSSGKDEENEEGIELSLGLSLGGRFGVDKNENRLIRSSSIASTFPIVRDDTVVMPRQQVLGRTASLPVVTEEEWRKRKELQTLRRMAAKRRRSQKQRVSREGMPPNWVAARVVVEQLKGVESLGGSSSGGSDLAQGSSSCGEASPASAQSSQNRSNYEAGGSKGKENASNSISKERDNPSKNVGKRNKEMRLNSLEDMPCVFTQGDGPNGRRIEGILYRYGKGEQVRIMCVCHGQFLSPAEFVEHAGGTDVAHPLKHIVVNPSSNSFL